MLAGILQEGKDDIIQRDQIADLFFAPNDKVSQQLSSSLSTLFDLGKGFGKEFSKDFEKLTVENCDSEQVWQQLQISSESILQKQEEDFLEESESESISDEIQQEVEVQPDEDNKSEDSSDEIQAEKDEPTVDRDKEENAHQPDEIVETTDAQDEFLIDEFERFHAMMEGKGDMEQDESDEENEDDDFDALKYQGKIEEKDLNDMLDKSKMKKEEEEKVELAENLSTYERNQLAIQSTIQRLEEKSLAGRGWQLMGEADATTRPKDSLVLQDLQFERGDKLKPVITPEKTEEIEDIIRQRILDMRFDDVERKEVPKEKRKRKLVEVESDKSKYGLAEIYEREFIDKAKESMGLETAKQEKLSKEHQEINKLKIELFYQLDALTSFHFTPKPVDNVEIEVNADVAAIEMEDALPTAQAQPDIVMEAPEEIYKVDKKAQVGESEKSRKEKKAEHRSRKRRKRKHEAKKTQDAELLENYRQKRQKQDSGKSLLKKLGAVEGGKQNFTSKAMFTILQDRKDSKSKPKGKTMKKSKRSLKL